MSGEVKVAAIGPVGETVAWNLRTIRLAARLSLRDVEALLAEGEHPIAHSGLSKIENRTRRVDVDDLVALAKALGVRPTTLLSPTAVRLVINEHEGSDL